jgi:hypothetical protein
LQRWKMLCRPIDGTARQKADESVVPLSTAGISIGDYVRRAPEARKPVGYDRNFLDRYRPNVSFYLTEQDRARLTAVGHPQIAEKEITPDDRQPFTEIVEAELASLHEGNFARYRIRPSEFAAWRQIWDAR